MSQEKLQSPHPLQGLESKLQPYKALMEDADYRQAVQGAVEAHPEVREDDATKAEYTAYVMKPTMDSYPQDRARASEAAEQGDGEAVDKAMVSAYRSMKWANMDAERFGADYDKNPEKAQRSVEAGLVEDPEEARVMAHAMKVKEEDAQRWEKKVKAKEEKLREEGLEGYADHQMAADQIEADWHRSKGQKVAKAAQDAYRTLNPLEGDPMPSEEVQRAARAIIDKAMDADSPSKSAQLEGLVSPYEPPVVELPPSHPDSK